MEKVQKHERVVKRWYEALEEGIILGTVCEKCGTCEFPPLYSCNTCGAHDMRWIEMSGEATLESFVLNGPMSEDLGEPYALGYVRVKEGAVFTVNVFGITKRNAAEVNKRLPMPVKMEIWQRDGYKTICFRVTKEMLKS